MNILDTAKEVIYGDREKTYGHPAKNLKVIAELWQIYLKARYNVALPLTADDVCVMMVLLKQARLANQITHKDSQVDSCGYMALLERVQEFESSNKVGAVVKGSEGKSNQTNTGGDDERLGLDGMFIGT